jgi:CRISPR system Cascade subunit CasD
MLLRLAGPLQSWGERSAFNGVRDSAAFPTRSGLIGMFAAAEGRGRHEDPSHYAELGITVRVDRPGSRLVDYHTVGGGQPKDRTAATSGGDHKGSAVITRRHYLSDAVFVVAVTGPGPDIKRIARALQRPYWNPYLGRRSCVPDEPFVLRADVDDPIEELLHRVPLSPVDTGHERGSAEEGTVFVDFLWESHTHAPLPPHAVTTAVFDVPISFSPQHRSYGRRDVHRVTRQLPARLRTTRDQPLRRRLLDYAANLEQEIGA